MGLRGHSPGVVHGASGDASPYTIVAGVPARLAEDLRQ